MEARKIEVASYIPDSLWERKIQENWDEQEATFRLQTLFKIMFYCARYGRRVREQVLAFGIFPDIDRNSQTCQCNGVSTATDIPEEGLLLYPVAVRAPTGHGDARGTNDVELKPTLLSHPLAPSTVVAMPVCFHITSSRNLKRDLERSSNSWWIERKFENFYILQSIRPMGSTIVEGDEKCGHQERRICMPLHPHGDPDE